MVIIVIVIVIVVIIVILGRIAIMEKKMETTIH